MRKNKKAQVLEKVSEVANLDRIVEECFSLEVLFEDRSYEESKKVNYSNIWRKVRQRLLLRHRWLV